MKPAPNFFYSACFRVVTSKETPPLRKFGIEPVGNVPWGTHLCQFYESKQDLADILVPYFSAGLRNNEFCMWVTSPPLEVTEAKKALRQEIPELDEYVRKGQIEFLSYKDWYLLGGKFDADRVLDGWVAKEKAAIARGFGGLRLTGNTFWIERSLWKSFADYEGTVNKVIGEHKILALCTYSVKKCTGGDVVDVVRNHVGTLIKRGGCWVLVEDSWQRKQTEEELKISERRLGGTLDSMMDGCQIISPDWRYLYINDAAARHGRSKKELLLGKTMTEMYPGIEKTEVFSKIEKCMKQKVATVTETEFTFPDGGKGWFQLSIQPVPEGVLIISEDITDRKLAEHALERAKRDWERTFDSVPDLIAVLDNKHRIVRANKAMATRLSTIPEKCIGLNCYKCVHGRSSPPDFCPHSKTMKDGEEHIAEMHEDRLGGDFLVSTSPLRDEHGNLVGSVHVARDITELKRVEQELRNSQRDLKHAQAVARTGSWRLNVRRNELLWSDEAYKIFGIPLGTPLTYESFLGFVLPADRKFVDQTWNDALRGEPYDVEHRIEVNGKVKWVREKAELEFDSAGILLGGFGTVQDITDRKKLEEALRKSGELARGQLEEINAYYDTAPVGLCVFDTNLHYVRVNKRMAEINGRPVSEHIGRTPQEILPTTAEHAEQLARQIIESGEPVRNIEFTGVTSTQPRRKRAWLESWYPLKDFKGHVVGINVVSEEITDLKEIEQELRVTLDVSQRRQAEISALLEVSKAVLQHRKFDLSARSIFNSCKDLLGATAGYVALLSNDGKENRVLFLDSGGLPCTVDPSLPMPIRGLRAEAYRNGKVVYSNDFAGSEWTSLMPEGHVELKNVLFAPLTIDKKTVGIIGLANKREGFTERDAQMALAFGELGSIALMNSRMLEALQENEKLLKAHSERLEQLVEERTKKLKDAERLATIGETAGMVGHDIRNPLQSIIGEVYLAKDDVNSLPESEAKNSLKETIIAIEEQAEYINKIVTDLQDFAKPLMPCVEEVDLSSIAQSVSVTVGIPENVKFASCIEKGFPKFKADSAYVRRILSNLFSNAVQAMPNGGNLTLRAQKEPNSVIITVEDTGVGIPEEFKPRIFQPLSTTKSKGQGFGLAVCKRLVEAMKGMITYDSEKGKGTKFTIRLPFEE